MTELDAVIQVKNLTKSFDHKRVVNDVNLTVKQGDIYGFLGPNGSGKTTTIRMLCGLLTPDSGSGSCLGYDVLHQSREIKKQVGYMTQKFSLYGNLTVKENLDFNARLYGIARRRQTVEALMKEMALHDRRSQLAATLSGGWKQRLALAAALVHQPKLLLLDEPTAGVDPKARRDFWDKIHQLSAQGITTLVATHYMDEAERCSQLAFIAYGEMLAHGSPNDIVQQYQYYTYEVRGSRLYQLADELKQHPVVKQVVTFGQSLHVSSDREAELQQLAKQYGADLGYRWQQVTPNLEDVFIALVGDQHGT